MRLSLPPATALALALGACGGGGSPGADNACTVECAVVQPSLGMADVKRAIAQAVGGGVACTDPWQSESTFDASSTR